MAAPTVYRWDDAGAPILQFNVTDKRNAFVQLFKTCLVNGYGDKLPPEDGYSLEFENAEGTAIALKSKHPASNGFYYNITNDSGTNAHINYISVCENMTDATTRINTAYTSRLFAAYDYSSSYYNSPIAWVLIADGRFFYFFCWTKNTEEIRDNPDFTTVYPVGAGCWGDFISPYDDPWSTVAYGYQSDGYQGSYFGKIVNGYTVYSNNECRTQRAYTGEAGGKIMSVMHGGGPLANHNDIGVMGGWADDNAVYPAAPFNADLPFFISRPFMAENNSIGSMFFRGWFPGLYYPCHRVPFKNFETVEAGGKTFIAMRILKHSYDYGQVLIDLGDWWV